MMKKSLLALTLATAPTLAVADVVQLTLESHLFGRAGAPSASLINPGPSFAGDSGNIPAATYWYDIATGALSSSGITHLRTQTSPLDAGRHFDRFITDLNIVNGSATGSTAYSCVNGGFTLAVNANFCGNYLLGDNYTDDSAMVYAGIAWTRTMGGDDVIAGDPQTIEDYSLIVQGWDGTTLTLESPTWTSSGGTAGLQMTLTAVPIPAVGWLMAGGLAVLGFYRRPRDA